MRKKSIQMSRLRNYRSISSLVVMSGRQLPLLEFERRIVHDGKISRINEYAYLRDMDRDDTFCPTSYIKAIDDLKFRYGMVIFVADPKDVTEYQAIAAACYLAKKNYSTAADTMLAEVPKGGCSLTRWDMEVTDKSEGSTSYALVKHSGVRAIYSGFSKGTLLKIQLQIIAAFRSLNPNLEFRALIMTPEVFETPEVRAFCMEQGAFVVKLPKPEPFEAENILKYMFRGTGLTADEKLWGRVARALKRSYGRFYSEKVLYNHSRQAVNRAEADSRDYLVFEDFVEQPEEKSVSDELSQMVGLDSVKQQMREFEALLEESVRNPRIEDGHHHMIFYGNPGSGKTTCARIVAKMLSEHGISCGNFVEISRSDFIGKYVGHTAGMVKDCFERARGGVLFMDEAGFFVQSLENNPDDFVAEALKEIVRFMENMPDVTVIFAMYENEVDDFLKLDEGLRSRISRMVHFEDYTADQMMGILDYMLEKKGYALSSGCGNVLREFLSEVGGDFGNARGVRKLADDIILSRALRLYDHPEKAADKKLNANGCYMLTSNDVKAALERMKQGSIRGEEEHHAIGFHADFNCTRKTMG